MGYMRHDVVVVTFREDKFSPATIETFRESLPDEFRRLLVGPVGSAANCYVTYMFAPDGSEEGWSTSDTGDQLRAEFIALFRSDDGSSLFDIVEVRFGGDYGVEVGATIIDDFSAKTESR